MRWSTGNLWSIGPDVRGRTEYCLKSLIDKCRREPEYWRSKHGPDGNPRESIKEDTGSARSHEQRQHENPRRCVGEVAEIDKDQQRVHGDPVSAIPCSKTMTAKQNETFSNSA